MVVADFQAAFFERDAMITERLAVSLVASEARSSGVSTSSAKLGKARVVEPKPAAVAAVRWAARL
jgi:hypothetical protein